MPHTDGHDAPETSSSACRNRPKHIASCFTSMSGFFVVEEMADHELLALLPVHQRRTGRCIFAANGWWAAVSVSSYLQTRTVFVFLFRSGCWMFEAECSTLNFEWSVGVPAAARRTSERFGKQERSRCICSRCNRERFAVRYGAASPSHLERRGSTAIPFGSRTRKPSSDCFQCRRVLNLCCASRMNVSKNPSPELSRASKSFVRLPAVYSLRSPTILPSGIAPFEQCLT